jgi:SAM-dependent methyltransferase
MDTQPFASSTLSLDDMSRPEFAPVARELRGFALRLGLEGIPFAVNGILRRRVWVRQYKLWEYTRGVACVRAIGAARILDFGGAATLPVFFLAQCGCEVLSLDVDAHLADWTDRVAARRGWKLRASTMDITRSRPPAEWGAFDAAISFSVLEHIPQELQGLALERLAALLRPGGVLAVTFDYGSDAPVAGAVRTPEEVNRLVGGTGLTFLAGDAFVDTGQRYPVDRRHPRNPFTFASLFLRKSL